MADSNQILENCSMNVQKAVIWLENEVKYDEKILKNQIEELEDSDDRGTVRNIMLRRLEWKLESKYTYEDALSVYVLNKFNSNVVNEFLEASKSEKFWFARDDSYPCSNLFDEPGYLWFLDQLGLSSNNYFIEAFDNLIKNPQSMNGELYANFFYHTGPLRVLVSLEPHSQNTKMAIDYFLDNLDSLSNFKSVNEISIGILALSEHNYFKFKNVLSNLSNYLKSIQNNEGYWKEGHKLIETSLAINALSRIDGCNNDSVMKGINWIISQQHPEGSWGLYSQYNKEEVENDHIRSVPHFKLVKEDEDKVVAYSPRDEDTSHAILALMTSSHGPTVPLSHVEWKEMIIKQELEQRNPHFVHTSPLYDKQYHVRSIHNKYKEMFSSAQNEIRIISSYIDLMYEEITDLAKNQNVTIKIITRPAKDIKGTRNRIAKNVLDILKIATRGNIRKNDITHTRMIIIDDDELMVSSADLTRDQLFDEFNAGIWTKDKETVKNAIDFFENLWEESEKFNG